MSNQFRVILISEKDYELQSRERLGTKFKFWFTHPNLGSCLYKQILPNTGEDWAEKIASELCELLQLPHAQYELAETWEGDKGIVSVNFISQENNLEHGNEILTNLVPDYPTFATYNGYEYTIDLVFHAIENSQVILPPNFNFPRGTEKATDLFVGYLLLDTWIGNGDRHHENWGFISQKINLKNIIYLAPTYDHASCLSRELLDEQRKVKSLENYAQKCLSAFYDNNKKRIKSFELFCKVANSYPDAAMIWLSCLESISDDDINLIFDWFPSNRISDEAAKFAKKILNFNKNRLLSLKK